MPRVALRGITTRRLRTVLTALAIVLGVAMVSGSYTLTDTMRGAADSLSSSAYDGTAAVGFCEDGVQGRRGVRHSTLHPGLGAPAGT
jgi:putative ABC transport system permease protein